MALIDMGERPTWGGGFITVPVARLPSTTRVLIRTPASVVAYYSDGNVGPEAVAALRTFLIATAQRMIEDDPAALRPGDRPDDPPWVLIDHEALEIS